MPKRASSWDNTVDAASMVVNVEKQSSESSEESDTYNVKPKEGAKPYTSLIALNGKLTSSSSSSSWSTLNQFESES